MGRAFHLQGIMNDVSACIDRAAQVPSPVTELQAFMLLDPLLAGLHKEYADAKANRCQSEKDFGKHEPMTDMALLVEDSAWCAMQTRYMELRADRALMVQAQAMMEDERLKEARKREQDNIREALHNYNYLEMLSRLRSRKKEQSDMDFVWAMIFLLGNNMRGLRLYQPAHEFNRLAA